VSEVLVTNTLARPVPVVKTGMPRWEVSGGISIPELERSGDREFTIPANTLFVVTFVSVEGRYEGITGLEPAALKVFILEAGGGPTFTGWAPVCPVVRRLAPKRSAVCQVLEFVIEAGKKPSTVSVELDSDVGPGDHYVVQYVLQGYLQKHVLLTPGPGLEPIGF